jgi:hypothetical protein
VEHRRTSDTDTLEVAEQPRKKPPEAHEIREVRASDLEPYTGLRYLSKLFRFMAVVLVLLLVAEIATGLYMQGTAAIPTLLGQASRLIVLAGVLWGTGDLAHLLIDVGHDVRAGRIMLARSTHAGKAFMPRDRSRNRSSEVASGAGAAVERTVTDHSRVDGGQRPEPPVP